MASVAFSAIHPYHTPQTGVSHGDGFCPISPFAMPDTALVWSNRPTFTWQSPEGFATFKINQVITI